MITGKRGKIYLKFLIAAALLFTLIFALYTLAANPSASPAIVADRNFSNANVSSAFANSVIFGYANFTSSNGTTEANSAFKCPRFVRDSPSLLLGERFKRTLYQLQNRGDNAYEVEL